MATSTSKAKSTTRTSTRSKSAGQTAGAKSASQSKSTKSAQTTTDHEVIRRWVEERGGFPATVKRTHGQDDPGLLRIDFPGYSGETSLERIEWDEWFKGFEDNDLAFLYEDAPENRFNKLISRSSQKQ